jgi:polysaccharide deacetylase 2 family uncharacterized protein YibQ
MARAIKKKKSRGRAKKKTGWRIPQINLRALFYALFLLSMLVFSIGVLGYFVFFRTVVAAELSAAGKQEIIFEEPLGPAAIVLQDERSGDTQSPKCAIIIDDMGYHNEIGRGLMNLPLNLTFSFLPHAPYTRELEEIAYKIDRTILLHLPLEPQASQWDPGPGALYLGDVKNQSVVFERDLNMVPHATGVNNHMGSLYTEDRESMTSLLKLIAKKKLFFIDSYTSANSKGFKIARELGVDAARRNLFLDNILSVEEICRQVKELVAIAKKRGSAIGIAHPNAETLQALRSCGDVLHSSVMLVGVDELL